MKQFYRVLTPTCEGVPGTIERWQQGKHTSTHGETPGQWTQKWNEDTSTNPADYALELNGCTYTEDARKAFLELAPTHLRGEIWPLEELNRTGEYEGVSAYNNVGEALNYGGAVPGKMYVVFEGQRLFRLPERDGWAVKFEKELLRPMRRDEFEKWITEGCYIKGKLGTYGCACRCLLQLAAEKGAPIQDDDFVARFSPQYPHWETQCGLTDTAMICELAIGLGLARGVQVFRDYEKVIAETKAPGFVGILVCVERFPKNPLDYSGLNVLYHCTLLKDIEPTKFVLWSPNQDGSELVWPPFTQDYWDKLFAHALVLKR